MDTDPEMETSPETQAGPERGTAPRVPTPAGGDDSDFVTGVDWIDRHPWFVAIGCTPADPQSCDDHELFEDLESEMMKRGTLSQGSIRWDWVGDQSALLLKEVVRDLRLVQFLVLSAPRCALEGEPLALASALVARFVVRDRPAPGTPRDRNRVTRLVHIVEALEAQCEKVREAGVRPGDSDAIRLALNRCADVMAEDAPDLGVRLAILPTKLETPLSGSELAPAPSADSLSRSGEAPAPSGKGSAAAATVTSLSPPRSENLLLDVGNERALKQSLVVVADFLLTLDLAHPLSYQVRRFATWYGITSPPPVKAGERTVVPPISENAAESYRIAADRGQGSDEVVRKLERSTHLQPFWIEGQWLAWRLAKACARSGVAEAIALETGRFVSRLEELRTLKFSDGSPFVSPEVADWLARSQDKEAGAGARSGAESAEHEAIRLAREKAGEGQFAEAMALLDSARPRARSVRSGVLWEIQVLEALSDWGLKTHASLQAERIGAAISGVTVAGWEPDLMERLGRLRG